MTDLTTLNILLNIKQVSDATGISPHRIQTMIEKNMVPVEQDGKKGHRKINSKHLDLVREADTKIRKINRGGGASAQFAALEARVAALEEALGVTPPAMPGADDDETSEGEA